MTEVEWLACVEPHSLLEWLEPHSSERKLLLFCVACCREVGVVEPRTDGAILDAIERYVDGMCVVDEVLSSLSYMSDGCPALGTGRYVENRADGFTFSRLSSICYNADLAAWCINGQLSESQREVAVAYRRRTQAQFVRDILGNPFRPVAFAPEWRTDTVKALAAQMYESRDFSAMPIFADALQDVGCDSSDILTHCRGEGPHVRGCWVCDLVLDKE